MARLFCIVLGIDGSEGARYAAEWAGNLARRLSARVIAVHAVPTLAGEVPLPPALPGFAAPVPAPSEEDMRNARRVVEQEWGAPLRDAGVDYRAEVVLGSPASSLIGVARRMDADLIVVGSRGLGGFRELLLGSVSQQLTHHADRPVVVVPSTATT